MAAGMDAAKVTSGASMIADVTGLGGDCGGPGISGCLSHAVEASTSATPETLSSDFLQAIDNFSNC
jgi:hypothetical protein